MKKEEMVVAVRRRVEELGGLEGISKKMNVFEVTYHYVNLETADDGTLMEFRELAGKEKEAGRARFLKNMTAVLDGSQEERRWDVVLALLEGRSTLSFHQWEAFAMEGGEQPVDQIV